MKTATATWILLGIVWIGLYWPLLAGQVPAFRDAYHFYYPLEFWLELQAQQGDIFPQFSPLDGTGVNLVGEMTTGLFYPGRILWWLPGLSVAQRLGVVLLAHTVIAGVGAAYAARRMKLGEAPQLLAATAYSLSGPVFFQHVNPIYLISAAWLPWVMAECWAMTRQESRSQPEQVRWTVWIVGCCLMLLGGDPQCTFHCGLISVVALLLSVWNNRSLTHTLRGSARLTLAVLAVSALTAVQTLPTWYWYQAVANEPTITNEASTNEALERDHVPALLQAIPPTTYDVARGSPYAYSIAPWHMVSLLWSNSLGHFMPEHSRLLSACPAEPRMWTASLSIGLLSALLTIGCFCQRETRRRTSFLWLVVLLSGTAMLGNYGPVWMLRNMLRWFGLATDGLPGDEVGGTYWMLTQLVPGYDLFRYPAKWSPFFAASLTLCAAQGLEHWQAIQKYFHLGLRCVTAITWPICLAVLVLSSMPGSREAIHNWLGRAEPDAWLGACDMDASLRTILMGFVLSSLLLLTAMLIHKRLPTTSQPWCLVWLVMFELGVCDHHWLATTAAPENSRQLNQDIVGPASPTLMRVWASVGQANITHDMGQSISLTDKLQYEQQFDLGKLHLLESDRANLSAFMTLTPRALSRVRHHLAQHDPLKPENPGLDEALAWLGVQQRLVRTNQLEWHSIATAAPMIELTNSHPEDTLHVKYFGVRRLDLKIKTKNPARLVLRLFQDGGWQAKLLDASSSRTIEPTRSHLGLFQSLDIPAGDWEIELRYQAPGLVTGAWISVVSLLGLGLFGFLKL